MPGAGEKKERKALFFQRLVNYLDNYPIVICVHADNVGSKQLQTVRKQLRVLDSHMLMGKNTLIRKVIRGHISNNPLLEQLLPLVSGNVGFVFCKSNLKDIRKIILENRVGAPAKVGTIAPLEVVVPAGPTGLEPTQTGFLQALSIGTKINKGQVEILKDHLLIKVGQRIGNSEAQLLHKLNIRPFTYGLEIKQIYDAGSVYDVKVLDLSDEDILAKFQLGVHNIACVSLATGIPTTASVPHSLMNGYKNILAISLATNYTIEQAKKLKELLANPEALKAAMAAASAPAATSAAPAKAKEKEEAKAKPAEKKKEEEKKEEDDGDLGLGLFG